MNNSALKLGYWAAVVAIVAFIAYTICFVAILLVNPIFLWTNFENYIEAVQSTNQFYKHIAMLLMIIYGISFIIQLGSIEEIVEKSKKYYVKIAKLFGIGFSVLISTHYFIQISTVRLQIEAGLTNGLEQFIQGNPISAVSAINMLGWTIFFGLSCIFIALALGNTKLEKITKYAFLVNGIIMFIGAFGYLFNLVFLVFFCMNIGLGGAILTATIFLCKLFKSFQLKQKVNPC